MSRRSPAGSGGKVGKVIKMIICVRFPRLITLA